MSEDPKATFEFDPLPGDAKPEEPAPAKPRRKKRGARRVEPQKQHVMAQAQEAVATAVDAAIGRIRKKREPKADLGPEFAFIKQLMNLTEPTRKRVLTVLNQVFG